MKNYILYVVVTALLGGISAAQAELICNPIPTTVEEAKACMQGFLGNTNELQTHLQNNNHFGDMSQCQKTQPTIPSYFANNGIDKVMRDAAIQSCIEEGSEYKCLVNLYQNACFITQQGTRSKTKTAIMRVQKDSGKLIDFYPVNKRQ
jgi:hypothetical protein